MEGKRQSGRQELARLVRRRAGEVAEDFVRFGEIVVKVQVATGQLAEEQDPERIAAARLRCRGYDHAAVALHAALEVKLVALRQALDAEAVAAHEELFSDASAGGGE